MTYTPRQLSEKAFEELRIIAKEELGKQIADYTVEDLGLRLLRLFKIIATPGLSQPTIMMTESESKALIFLKTETGKGISPSIRDLCKFMGFRSSRSGFRLLSILISKGLGHRDDTGILRIPRV